MSVFIALIKFGNPPPKYFNKDLCYKLLEEMRLRNFRECLPANKGIML